MFECGICFDPMRSSNALASTLCGHVFHQQCLMSWLGRSLTCPQCRVYTIAQRTIPLFLNFFDDDEATMRNLERRIIDLQRRVEMKDTEIVASRTTNQALTAKVESQNVLACKYAMKIDQLRMELDELSRQLKMKTEDAEDALQWLKVREQKIRYLEDRAKVDKEAYEEEIERQRAQAILIKDLTAKCSALETSKRKLEVDLEKRENDMEVQEQQDKLIEEFTARCSDLETLNRKLESELEKRVHEISILQKSRAIKEEPLSPPELVPEERQKEVATAQEARAVNEEPAPSNELKSKQREKKVATVPEARVVKEEPAPSTEFASKGKRTSRQALSAIDSNTDTQAARRKQGYLKRPR